MKTLRARHSVKAAVGVLLAGLGLASGTAEASADNHGQIRFNRDVRPILADSCFHCHGADPSSRKAKLRLDTEEGFFAARAEGPAVVKGKPDASPLYKRIISTDPDEVMPPDEHKALKPKQKETIKAWIAQGAHWEPHWSFIKPQRPELPKVKNEAWIRKPLDRFVLAKLESVGMEPAPEADKRTLARRVSLDLTGLPPEPEVVEAFAADNAPEAYEKLVDKLLESPRYGEHRARYWLDAARYGDTHGLHFDNYREMWLYRDWVINAYNRNLPFDQFTIEQLAGDLLPNPTKEQIIATGFHRCNITTNEGGTIAEENLANYARDRVETTSFVWLGLTANCAVCHDHKFDPITQKDFYSMSAYFRNTTQGALDGNVKDSAPVMVLPRSEDEKRWEAIGPEVEAAKTNVNERKKKVRPEFDKWLESAKPADWDAIAAKGPAPTLHLPLITEGPLSGLADGKTVEVKSAEKIVWADGGKLGKAPNFTAKSATEIVTDIGNFEKDQPFSYGAWVRTPKEYKGGAAVLSRMDDKADYRGWDLWAQDTEFGAHFINKWPDDAIKVVTTGKVLKPGTWQHVFVTYDGSSKAEGFKIYVDGKESKLKTEANKLNSTTKSTAPLYIGQRKTTSQLAGLSIQDLRIENRRLDGTEVLKIAMRPKMAAILGKAAKDRSAKEKDEVFDAFSSTDPEMLKANETLAKLESEKKVIKDRSIVTHIQEEKKGSMPMANILFRGEYDKPKDKVEAASIAALHPMPQNAPKNRLGLAQWLVSPENALTARVTVNRYWQEIFGTGLVKTSEDFGIMGEQPANVDLLDYLAVEFREGGWNTKQLIKQLVLSAAYRQAAVTTPVKIEKDVANRLISRGPRFRMDAEMIRDYALSAGSVLSAKIGGPSVRPYQPDGIWDVVGMPGSDTRNYKRDTGEGLYRRSVYTFWKRHAPPVSMDTLNAPSREFSCVRRERTNTPLQALVTLNDPQFVEAARLLAQNAMKAKPDDAGRLDYVARHVLLRPFSEKETAIVQGILKDLLAHYTGKPEDVKALLDVGETKSDAALNAAQLAAWTMFCNQMLNLDEVLNK